MLQTVSMVDKATVEMLHNRLNGLLNDAKDIQTESSFVRIEQASKSFYKASELYSTLNDLELLDGAVVTKEDIEIVGNKISFIKEEKRRKYGFQWKGGNT